MTDAMLILGKDLPDDLLRAIGLITQLTGQIEYELALAIKRTGGMSMEEAFKLAAAKFHRQALQSEARGQYERWALDQKKEAEFGSILSRIEDIASRRGKVTHDCWAYLKDRNEVCRNRFGQYVPVDPKELEDLARDMKQVIADLTAATGHPEFVQYNEDAAPETQASLVANYVVSSTGPGLSP